MLLRYRVGQRDVAVEVAAGTTVGDLAVALAGVAPAPPGSPAGPLTLRTLRRGGPGGERPGAHHPVPAPGDPASRSAPPSGSTVEVVPGHLATDRPPLTAPVRLQGPGRRSRTLHYGSNQLAGGVHLEVTERLLLVTAGDARVHLDGERVGRSARPVDGSLLRIGDEVATLVLDGTLRPPSPGPFHPLSRARRRWPPPARPAGGGPPEPRDPVEFPTPPTANRRPGLPVLTAVVPLLLGAGLWWATRSPAVVGFVLASFLFVLAAASEQRREWRAEERFRVREFRADLAEAVAALAASHEEDRRRDEAGSPPVTAVAAAIAAGTAEPWSAAADGELVVRLGTRSCTGDRRPRVPVGGRRTLRTELTDAVAAADRTVRPLTVDLRDGLGIAGAGDLALGLARAVVVQAAAAHGPDELALEIVAGPAAAPRWEWAAWLPHHGAAGDRALRVVDDPTPAQRRGLSRSPEPATVWLAARPQELPDDLRAVVRCAATTTLQLPASPPRPFDAEPLDVDSARTAARALSPLVPEGTGAAGGGAGPTLADLLDDVRRLTDPAHLRARWDAAITVPHRDEVGAPLGLGSDGVIGVDLAADGPHALVAGTTGSGKSELLRTLVLSLALHHPPERLSFLLVDYKGGETFAPLADLPHAVGVVTDLTPALCARALVALGAELRRRETATVGPPPPRLVVVVDEFATLAREVPDFVDGVLDIARRGRSLGIHLVLATQRPADAVTDAIRANTELRIALRVADAADSDDVLGAPDAATLPRSRPGTALLRTGPDRLQPVRVASCAGPVRHRTVVVRPLAAAVPGDEGGGTHDGGGPSELATAVTTCRAASEGRPTPAAPWLPPLAETMAPPPPDPRPGRLAVGWVDRPDLQDRPPLVVDLTAGGVLVLGGPGSGRSTALRALAVAAAGHPEGVWSVHLLGADGAPDASDAALVDRIVLGDTERDLRLLRHLCERPPGTAPALVLVDGIGPFLDLHDHVNRGEAARLLGRLATHGRATGVHMAVAARRPSEVPPDLRSALTHRLVLRGSPDDLEAAGAAPGLFDASTPAGRGVLGGHPVQVVVGDPPRRPAGPVGIARLPTEVPAADLPPADGWWIPLGPAADDPVPGAARPIGLDLSRSHALVIGPPRAGRSAALELLAGRVAAGGAGTTVVRIDGRRGDPSEAAGLVLDLLGTGATTPVLLLVDDLPDLLDAPGGDRLDDALLSLVRASAGTDDGASAVRVVATAEADALARCYGGVARRLRVLRTGVLLRPDPDLHPPLLHTELPLRQELPAAAGRGWVVTPDAAPALVQLARA
ncbi:MAG: FtsK/SpoIIIE domain-containing protein [Microthrixaceae bacterium]